MKKFLQIGVCTTLLLWLPFQGWSQVEHRMLDTNSSWRVSGGYLMPPYIHYCYTDSFSELDVNGWKDYQATMNNLRFFEDTSDHTVHIIISDDTILLYDFRLEVGDTFHWHPRMMDTVQYTWYASGLGQASYGYSIVNSIDSVLLLDSTQRRRIELKNLFFYEDSTYIDFGHDLEDLTWMDGIGATRGIFYPVYGMYFESHTYYTAYRYEGELLFQWDDCPHDPLGIDDNVGNNQHSLLLWPNPVEDVLHVESEEEVISLQVMDMAGREFDLPLQSDNTLHTSGLPSGVYVLKVVSPEGARHAKFIRQ